MATDDRKSEPKQKAEEGHKKKFKPGKGTGMSNPPLTPLIDVFLFLIIFFLLSCQFHQAEGTIPANLPSNLTGANTGPPAVHPPPIKIYLKPSAPENTAGYVIEIDGVRPDANPTDMEGLYEFLNNRRSALGDEAAKLLPVIITPMIDKNHKEYGVVHWGLVVDAFNQAVRSGFKQIALSPSNLVMPSK